MIKKLAAVCCVALAMGMVADTSPATAKTTRGSGVWVSVGGHARPLTATAPCSYGETSYEQRMVVDGESYMMPVAWVVAPGRYEAFIHDTCNGYIVYAFGACLCNFVFVEVS